MFTFATFNSSNIDLDINVAGIGSQNEWEIAEIKFHLGTAATAANNLVVKQKSKRGNQYDTVIFAQPMQGVQDIIWQPDYAIKLNGLDKLNVAWTNDAASFKTWGIQVSYKA